MVSLQTALLAMSLCGSGETVLLDFSAEWCGPCRRMAPVVRELDARYPVREVNVDQSPELARRFGVTKIPCFIMVVDGRAVERKVGIHSYQDLERMCQAGLAASASARQDPPTKALPPSRPGDPGEVPGTPPTDRLQPPPGPQPPPPPVVPGRPAETAVETAARGPLPVADDQLLAATVRLRVEDPNGYSWGTGTIIDARQGSALIVTCAHIFRDSGGKGRIEVNLFGPNPADKICGRLVSWDLKRDVALVAICPPGPVTVARVAPAGYEARKGQAVAGVGCNGGADPTVRHSRVTAINRFLGPHNILVAGQSVRGRSGGGLFTSSGMLIGVCHGANPSDNEAMFMALDAVHEELDRANLSYVYRTDVQGPGDGTVPGPQPLPKMPTEMPETDRPAPVVVVPLLSQGTAEEAAGGPLSPEEQAAVGRIQRMPGGAEVICIVRSLDDPRAKSQIIVLDKASPAFLNQLASEARIQDQRHLTSAVQRDGPNAQAANSHSPAIQANADVPVLLPRKHPQPTDSPERFAGWDPHWLTRAR